MNIFARSPRPAPATDSRQTAYVKTDAGRTALADRRSGLAVRDRQIMLLCNGTQTLSSLEGLFGPEVGGDLLRLRRQGLIEAQSAELTETLRALAAEQDPPPRASAGDGPDAQRSAVILEAKLMRVRLGANLLIQQLNLPAAQQLKEAYRDSQLEADVLVYVSRVMGLIERELGAEKAAFEAERLARMLPRDSVSLLLDCLLDEVKPELVGHLYERLLADTEFGDNQD